MKRNIARVAFWCLLYIELLVIRTIIGNVFAVFPAYDTRHITTVSLPLAVIFAGGLFFLYRIYDPFREKYSTVQKTPLRFHKFNCYVWLPVSFLITIKTIFDVFSAEDFPSNSLYVIDLAYEFLYLVLACVCFVGLRKFKPYAWRVLMINYSLGIFYLFVAVIIHIVLHSRLLDTSLFLLMDTIHGSAMRGLYYYKRKNLFLAPRPSTSADQSSCSSDSGAPASEGSHIQNEETPHTVKEESTPKPDSAPKIFFCRNCGHKLPDDSNFCSYCGTAVKKDM